MFKKKKKDEPIEKTVITQVTSLSADADKKAYILFLSGPLVGKLINLQEGSTVIGRADDADISINDIRISRHHLKIDIDEGRVQVEDLGSTNGTFINGTKVKRGKLEDGDKIQISSSTIFEFALQDRAENVFIRNSIRWRSWTPSQTSIISASLSRDSKRNSATQGVLIAGSLF